MNAQRDSFANRNANFYQEALRQASFENCINSVPIGSCVASSSSSEDDSSIDDWREISKRLDSDFESEPEKVPKPQPLKISIARRNSIWKQAIAAPNASSTIKSKLRQPPKAQKPQSEASGSPRNSFHCTFPNCPRSYATQKSLDVHLNNHEDTKRTYLCTTCSQRFLRQQGLLSHIKSEHVIKASTNIVEPRVFPCNTCSLKFLNPLALFKHAKVHSRPAISPIGKNQCRICGKVYLKIQDLKKHCIKLHPNCEQLVEIEAKLAKMVPCLICNAKFSSTDSRQNHWRSIHKKPAQSCRQATRLPAAEYNIETEFEFILAKVGIASG